MEIFASKKTLRELEQHSQLTDLFSQSVDRHQINMTEEPWSFLNRTILETEYPNTKLPENPTSQRSNINFIQRNKELVKHRIHSDKTENQTDSNKNPISRPFTPNTNSSTKFTRFFASRNRPDCLYEGNIVDLLNTSSSCECTSFVLMIHKDEHSSKPF